MSYRAKYTNVLITAQNINQYAIDGFGVKTGVQIGDTVQVYEPPTKVDLRPFAQLRESLGVPYPDEDD